MKNKRLIIYLLIFIGLCIFVGFKPLSLLGIASLGKINYIAKNYKNSAKYYCLATKFERSNYDYSYYCINSLKELPKTYDVQKEIYDISMQNQGGAAKIVAQALIEEFKKDRIEKYEPNYINKIFSYGKIIRWDKDTFPLKVYWKDDYAGLVPDYFEDAIKTAFNTWQILTNKYITFKLTNDSNEANIVIDYNVDDNELMQECMFDECYISIATTEPLFSYNTLKRMTIIFNAKDYNDEYLTANQVYRAALHEIGHALGLLGHSDNPNDLMYMSDKELFYGANNISQSDLNTLKLLYDIAPDLTNTPLEEENFLYEIYSPIILGARKQVNMGAYDNAVNYIKKAPNSVNGWIDLASVYFEAKEYEKAIRSLRHAIKYVSNNGELYLCYFNFALIYNQMSEFEKALTNIEKAENILKNYETLSLKGRILFNLKKIEQAEEVLLEALEKAPDDIYSVEILAQIYAQQGAFIKSAKILKNLKLATPSINLYKEFPDKIFIILLSNFV